MTTAPPRRARGQLPFKAKPIEYGSVIVLPGGVPSIVVLGRPAPQGSKGPLGTESNPRTKPWRATIAQVCRDGLPADWTPMDGPLIAELWFYFDPPKSAKRGDIPCTKTTYDVDKLTRAIFDGLTEGGVVVDDARFADAHVHKRFVWPNEGEARVVAVVTRHSP